MCILRQRKEGVFRWKGTGSAARSNSDRLTGETGLRGQVSTCPDVAWTRFRAWGIQGSEPLPWGRPELQLVSFPLRLREPSSSAAVWPPNWWNWSRDFSPAQQPARLL